MFQLAKGGAMFCTWQEFDGFGNIKAKEEETAILKILNITVFSNLEIQNEWQERLDHNFVSKYTLFNLLLLLICYDQSNKIY
jgi:hypothetical protein